MHPQLAKIMQLSYLNGMNLKIAGEFNSKIVMVHRIN